MVNSNKNRIIVILLCLVQMIKLIIQLLQVNYMIPITNTLISEKYMIIGKKNFVVDSILLSIVSAVSLLLIIESFDRFISTKKDKIKNYFILFEICFVVLIFSIILDKLIVNRLLNYYSISIVRDFSIYNILFYISIGMLFIFIIKVINRCSKDKAKEVFDEYTCYYSRIFKKFVVKIQKNQ